MSVSETYNVVSTGDIAAGFDRPAVQQRLVSAMRLKPEQAARFFDKPRVVKKGVPRDLADRICGQLARIGVTAVVEQAPPPRVASPAIPSAAIPSQQTPPAGPLELVRDEAGAASQRDTLECPKCGHVQQQAEQCAGCGIWFHKFDPARAPAPGAAGVAPAPTTPPSEAEGHDVAAATAGDDGNVTGAAIAAAFGAALVGAWVWKSIAVWFGYEFGLIAWAIGGAIGFAAASLGSHGVKAGVACAVLALGAIGAGKYWSYSAMIGDFQQAVSSLMAEDDSAYVFFEKAQEDAALFVAGSGTDDFVRRFMVERGYTATSDPARVSADELEAFRTYSEPELREMAEVTPDFAKWQADNVAAVADVSPWAMIREGSGVLDILFALLGIGTAFRLGSGMH